MYPNSLTFKILESEHPEYTEVKEQYKIISLLSAGGYKLKARISEFLPIRGGESNEIYLERIKKFTYKNILSDAINKQATRIRNGSISLSNISDSEQTFWNDFRENTNEKGRTESDFVTKLFIEVLKYKKCYVHSDLPKSEVEPRNRAEELQLGLTPRLVIYSALEVVNWSEDEYIKVKQIVTDSSNPVSEPVVKVVYTFIDSIAIAKYEHAVKLNQKGEIVTLVSASGKELGLKEDLTIPLVSYIEHGCSEIPVKKLEIDSELWLADTCVAKAYEHLRLDCHAFDLLTLAYFQRTYKKVLIPDDNLDSTFEDYSNAPIEPGLQHVLELENFNWSEPEGTIVDRITAKLESCEHQIREMISLTGASATEKPNVQSGVSKELDYYMSSETLKTYGSILCDFLQDIYQLVSLMIGVKNNKLAVSGLNAFDTDNLGTLIERVTAINLIDFEALRTRLTPTLYILLREKMLTELIGNLTPLQKEEISQEILKIA